LKTQRGISLTYKIHLLECGEIKASESLLFDQGDSKVFQKIGCFAWLLQNAGERILIDTGIKDIDVVNKTRKGPQEWEQSREQKIENQISRVGLSPDDITKVILTHLHYDHCSNLTLFKNAQIYLAQKEWEAVSHPRNREHFKSDFFPQVIKSIQRNIGKRITLVGRHLQLDNCLELFEVGGHTPGSLIAKVTCDLGPCMLTGDAVFLVDNVRKKIPIGLTYDLEASINVLEILSDFEGLCLPSHDISVLDYFTWRRVDDV